MTAVASQKIIFCWKIPKIHTFPDSAAIHLNRVNWISRKFGKEMSDTCDGYESGRFKVFELLSGINLGFKNSWKGQKCIFFWYFLNPHMSQLSPSTIKICAKADHHTTCINAPAKNFYYFQGEDMPKKVKISIWIPTLVGSGLSFSKIATVKTVTFWKSRGKETLETESCFLPITSIWAKLTNWA